MVTKKTLVGLVIRAVCIASVNPMASSYGEESQTAPMKQPVDLSAEVKLPPGASWKTLVISSVRTVNSDLTIPSNLCLKFEDGGMCDVRAGATLTIQGAVEAPLMQIFRGSGSVFLGSGRVEKVYPQWWGAQTDDEVDDTSAIQAAIDSLSSQVAWTSGHVPPERRGGLFPGWPLRHFLKAEDLRWHHLGRYSLPH